MKSNLRQVTLNKSKSILRSTLLFGVMVSIMGLLPSCNAPEKQAEQSQAQESSTKDILAKIDPTDALQLQNDPLNDLQKQIEGRIKLQPSERAAALQEVREMRECFPLAFVRKTPDALRSRVPGDEVALQKRLQWQRDQVAQSLGLIEAIIDLRAKYSFIKGPEAERLKVLNQDAFKEQLTAIDLEIKDSQNRRSAQQGASGLKVSVQVATASPCGRNEQYVCGSCYESYGSSSGLMLCDGTRVPNDVWEYTWQAFTDSQGVCHAAITSSRYNIYYGRDFFYQLRLQSVDYDFKC